MNNLRRFGYLVAFLGLTGIITPVRAEYETRELPKIYSSSSDTWANKKSVDHTILIKMTDDYPISEIIVRIPDGLEIKDKVSVHTLNNDSIKINTEVKEQKLTISFPEEYQKNDILEIDLDNVLVKGISNGWNYRVSVVVKGLNKEIPIGTAFIRVFSR